MTRTRKILAALAVAGILVLGTASPALAYQPVAIVHTEHVQAGPYDVTVGFSKWPLRAMQSLDFTFVPDGGIAGLSGTLIQTGPGVPSDEQSTPLVRHPRKLDSWGLDVKAFDSPGAHTLGFEITGPKGNGSGTLRNLEVLAQPGPPLARSAGRSARSRSSPSSRCWSSAGVACGRPASCDRTPRRAGGRLSWPLGQRCHFLGDPPGGSTCAGGGSVVHVNGVPVGTSRSTDPGLPPTAASWAGDR